MKFSKKEEEIINNYLNSGRTDQVLKNAQMLGVIYTMLDRIEKLEKKIERLEKNNNEVIDNGSSEK